ncbi:MAG: GNAT family N-acetyltransferase [Actinomycetota bacterium]
MLPDLPPDPAMRIVTTRLDLIPITPDDADDLFPVLADTELGRFTGEDPPDDVEALRGRFAFWSSRRSPDDDELWLNWVVRRREDGRAVGHLQATVGQGDAAIAWVIGTAYQRRGFATEAGRALAGWLHNALGIPVVNGCIHPDNVASQTAAARIGLRPTDRWYGGEVVWTDAPEES